MVCLPLPALNPLDSERPFFSTATKGKGSDCAGTFTGPLCFQMVLFSCDTVDTQHLPRIWTLLWGSTEGGWRGSRGELWRDQKVGNLGGWNFFYINLHSVTASSLSQSYSFFMVFCPDSFVNNVFFYLLPPPPALPPLPHPVPYSSLPCPLLQRSLVPQGIHAV